MPISFKKSVSILIRFCKSSNDSVLMLTLKCIVAFNLPEGVFSTVNGQRSRLALSMPQSTGFDNPSIHYHKARNADPIRFHIQSLYHTIQTCTRGSYNRDHPQHHPLPNRFRSKDGPWTFSPHSSDIGLESNAFIRTTHTSNLHTFPCHLSLTALPKSCIFYHSYGS